MMPSPAQNLHDRRKEAERSDKKRRQREQAKRDKLDRALTNVVVGGSIRFEEGDDFDVREVDNPSFDPERPKSQARRYTAVVALRDDPIGRMARRRQLGNREDTDIRLKAARYWQSLYERSEIGGIRGIDPTRDVVDGGRYMEPDSDSRLQAQAELRYINSKLGMVGEVLTRRILGEKLDLRAVAVMHGETSNIALKALGRRLRECLDTIAWSAGLMVEAQRRHTRY